MAKQNYALLNQILNETRESAYKAAQNLSVVNFIEDDYSVQALDIHGRAISVDKTTKIIAAYKNFSFCNMPDYVQIARHHINQLWNDIFIEKLTFYEFDAERIGLAGFEISVKNKRSDNAFQTLKIGPQPTSDSWEIDQRFTSKEIKIITKSYMQFQWFALGAGWLSGRAAISLNKMAWKRLLSHLDPEIKSLMYSSFTFRSDGYLTSDNYNYFLSNKATLLQLAKESPSLMPALLSSATKIGRWRDGIPLDAIQYLKEIYLAKGLTNKSWRFISKLKPSIVKSLMNHNGQDGLYPPISLTNLLSEAVNGHRVPCYLIKRISIFDLTLHRWAPLAGAYDVNLLSAIIDKSIDKLKTGKLKEWVKEDLSIVLDYVCQTDANDWRFPKGIKYARIKQMSDQWHEQIASTKAFNGEQVSWQALTDKPIVINNVSFVEINNSLDLFKEGQQLHHCVFTYTVKCTKNLCRIFSVHSEHGRATLELKLLNGKSAVVEQLRGYRNSGVSGKTMLAANRFAKEYTKLMSLH